ncbi:molecular chaperone [uncultured Pseudomonas sp.]|uniref:fimbrial biogenesis chaperone n=1 Tax=uncultured Pseudomonas sp. TaxID=114707 RepID=UPI0025873E5A|nr:molecular chaperone [uncultured Pseudomonas sp.]
MFSKVKLLTFFSLLTLTPTFCDASVILNGTRIVFPSQSNQKTLQFSNPDSNPNLVQVWVSKSENNSSIENADVSFIPSPQVFKIESGSGQIVRLSYVGDNLPTDRESIFYLNFSQIPSLTTSSQDSNKLVLLFTSRVKLFYRPKEIQGAIDKLASSLQFRLSKDNNIIISNTSGFYVTIRKAEVIQGNRHFTFISDQMINPKSTTNWKLENRIDESSTKIRLVMINDYGVDTSTEFSLMK